jgi:hypothetical protein
VTPIRRFLRADHRRLGALATRLVGPDGAVDRAADDELRRGLLRHLHWEESILMRLAQQRREGEPVPFMTRVRLEHRAIRALLVPTPTAALVATLGRVLAAHEEMETAPGGFYDLCDTLASSDADGVVGRLRAVPAPDPPPHDDGPHALATVQRLLAQAGF